MNQKILHAFQIIEKYMTYIAVISLTLKLLICAGIVLFLAIIGWGLGLWHFDIFDTTKHLYLSSLILPEIFLVLYPRIIALGANRFYIFLLKILFVVLSIFFFWQYILFFMIFF